MWEKVERRENDKEYMKNYKNYLILRNFKLFNSFLSLNTIDFKCTSNMFGLNPLTTRHNTNHEKL